MQLENLSVPQQIEMMLRTTILIGARGAGLINALFMREGSALLALSIMRPELPVTTDQYPFYPFISFIPRRFVVITNCLARLKGGPCGRQSINFCDMRCPVDSTQAAMELVLGLPVTAVGGKRRKKHDALRSSSTKYQWLPKVVVINGTVWYSRADGGSTSLRAMDDLALDFNV